LSRHSPKGATPDASHFGPENSAEISQIPIGDMSRFLRLRCQQTGTEGRLLATHAAQPFRFLCTKLRFSLVNGAAKWRESAKISCANAKRFVAI
jgi:hypothetical protein